MFSASVRRRPLSNLRPRPRLPRLLILFCSGDGAHHVVVVKSTEHPSLLKARAIVASQGDRPPLVNALMVGYPDTLECLDVACRPRVTVQFLTFTRDSSLARIVEDRADHPGAPNNHTQTSRSSTNVHQCL